MNINYVSFTFMFLLITTSILLVGTPHKANSSDESCIMTCRVIHVNNENQVKACIENKCNSAEHISNATTKSISSNQTVSSSDDGQVKSDYFAFIDTDNINTNIRHRLFSVNNKSKFINNTVNGSPLLNKAPDKIAGSINPVPNRRVSQAMILQKYATDNYASKWVDTKLFHKSFFNALYRVLPRNRLFLTPVRVIDGIICIILDILFNTSDNLFFIYVDNAFNEDVQFQIDNHDHIKIPARKQLQVVFPSGSKRFRVTKRDSLIEQFTVSCSASSKENYYIYNIGAQNSYDIRYGSYVFK